MKASVFHRWQNADRIVLSSLYGRAANAVLSRPARKPVPQSPALRLPVAITVAVRRTA
jgi:hypothetical protein